MFDDGEEERNSSVVLADKMKEEGNELFKNGDFKEAIKRYTQAIEQAPSAAIYANRAAAYLALKNNSAVITDCEAALSLDPNFVKAYLRLGKAYTSLGRIKEAQDATSHALKIEPHNKNAESQNSVLKDLVSLKTKLDEALTRENWTSASNVLSKMTELCPDSHEVQVDHLRVLVGQRDYTAAASLSVTLLRRDPSDVNVICLRGEVLYYTNSLTQALKHFQEGLRNDPDHNQCRIMLKKVRQIEKLKLEGNEAFKNSDNQAAVNAYTSALAVDEKNDAVNAVLYCNRAAAKINLKDYQSALDDCNRSISIDQAYAKAYARRGQCYLKTSQFEEAVRDYQKASELEPNSSDYSSSLKNAKLELKKSKRKDLYKILDVAKNADEDEIKKAYKKQALRWHPDKHHDSDEDHREAEKRFKDIGEAYAILSDRQKRHRYDSGVDVEDIENPGAGMHADIDPTQIFNMFFNGGGGGGGGMRFHNGGGFPGGGGHHHGGGFPGGGHHFGQGPQHHSFHFG
jgi:DnaJ family protein C protein 7